MSRWKMVAYASLGSLVSVLIWSFVGGCQSAPTTAPDTVPAKETVVSQESGETLVEESFRADEKVDVPEVEKTPLLSPGSGAGLSHTVVKGDTLWAISRKYGVSVQRLQAANAISDPSRISVGRQLRIPAP